MFVSIIRVGLSETKHFSDGYDAIFGKKKVAKKAGSGAKAAKAAKKPAKKKAAKKK
jgi:hypothetical protein